MGKKRKQHSPTLRLALLTTPAVAGTPVTLGVSVSDLDGNLAAGSLDWGDGQSIAWTAVAPTTLTHTYSAAGAYTLRGTVKDTTGMTGSTTASITIQPPTPLPTISQTGVTVAGPTTGTTGQTLGYSATSLFSDGSTRSVTAQATWTSTVPAVATVAAGTVTCLTPGTTSIRASLGGFTGSVTLVVSAPPPTPPAVPNSPDPADGATAIALTPTLHWASAGAISYTVQFGTTSPPPQVQTGLGTTAYVPGTLLPTTVYVWRILATNNGGTTAGPIWTFTTVATGGGGGGGGPTQPSPDPTEVPPAPQIVDNALTVWTLGPLQPNGFYPILRDGVQQYGALGAKIAWCGGQIYVQGDDTPTAWYQFLGGTTGWQFVGGSDPCVAPPPPDPSTTRYVSTSGSDSAGTGTITNPWRTLTYACAQIVAGQVLLVRGAPTVAGIYHESLQNCIPSGTSWTNTVRIAAYPGETVWLTPTAGQGNGRSVYFGGDVGAPIVNPQYIEVDGINIDSRNQPYGAIVLDDRNESNPNHLRFQNLQILNNGGAGGGAGAIQCGGANHTSVGRCNDNEWVRLSITGTGGPYGIYVGGDRNLVDGCDIFAVGSLGIHIYRNSGTPQNNIVRNCRIHDITEAWFFGAPDTRIGGILAAGDTHQIYNNVIYNIRLNQAQFGTPTPYGGILAYNGGVNRQFAFNSIYNVDGEAIKIDSSSSGTLVRNNISYLCTQNGITNTGSGSIIDHNLVDGTNPQFVAPSSGNFHLQATSPAGNAGIAIAGITTDLDGVTRGNPPEIGAYEIVPPPVTTFYTALSVRDVRVQPSTIPTLGVAGTAITDPTFGSTIVRATDATTAAGQSCRVPSNLAVRMWRRDSAQFYVSTSGGGIKFFDFNPTTGAVTPKADVSVGYMGEPAYAFETDLIYGASTGSVGDGVDNYRLIKTYDPNTGASSTVIDLDAAFGGTIAAGGFDPGYRGGFVLGIYTYPGGWATVWGQTSADTHHYVYHSLSGRVLNTYNVTYNGLTSFAIHAATPDLSGRYVVLGPTGADNARGWPQIVVWDTQTNVVTAVPTAPDGHAACGYGTYVNSSNVGQYDPFEYVSRQLATPNSNVTDLITPVVNSSFTPGYLGEHPCWLHAAADNSRPFLASCFRFGAAATDLTTYPWRPYDNEIVAIDAAGRTNAAGQTLVHRFCHNRSVVGTVVAAGSDFWNQPIANVSPSGRWAAFHSNWSLSLGTTSGLPRQDVFLVALS